MSRFMAMEKFVDLTMEGKPQFLCPNCGLMHPVPSSDKVGGIEAWKELLLTCVHCGFQYLLKDHIRLLQEMRESRKMKIKTRQWMEKHGG